MTHGVMSHVYMGASEEEQSYVAAHILMLCCHINDSLSCVTHMGASEEKDSYVAVVLSYK